MHENKATTEIMEPKDLKNCSTKESDQLNNSGHGVCEYMGATHSSPHTAPDAKHSSTYCCPTHEIMSNREHIQRLKAYTAACNITHAQSKSVKQAHIRTSSLLSYNYHDAVPSNTDFTPAMPNTDTSSATAAQKIRIGSYELNQICPTLLTQHKALNEAQDYRREMTSRSTSSSSQVSKRGMRRFALTRGVQLYHSCVHRGCLPSEIEEDKVW
ncbi:transcription factor [Dorcoceras hygrometricum]|uniref:Transcription factor n=1 Tax=Dorcoceras hygrometricum TaxID=472368 RepID=A0A2Z7B9J0_9LAMI|nr:transcription factor [Dorcoceras hygrometricum]